ncbi:hypothetical protein [Lactococcus cremoris]|uniref:hypothetical protein n=1 Tax=Lactococcus lactis subsp. cremoris TaxID=1359 RepID=UPI002FC6D89D
MEYKVGELVLLPETKYPGVIGSVISENKSGILVRFNGAQQLYFKKADLQKYKNANCKSKLASQAHLI